MKQVEKHIIKLGHEWYDYCCQITTISKQLYNTVQYSQRQSFFYGWATLSQPKLDVMFKQNEHYKALAAKVAQLVLQQNADAWIGYYEAVKAYNLEPKKFTGKPKPPNYIEGEYNIIKFNNNKVKHTFSGKRVARAWYVSKDGLKIHADVNGAFNIGRKCNPDGFDCIKSILKDRGCLVVHPRPITPLFRRVRAQSGVA